MFVLDPGPDSCLQPRWHVLTACQQLHILLYAGGCPAHVADADGLSSHMVLTDLPTDIT